MGIATHLGPWLLGTNRYTTGTTADTTRNTGATVVAQTKTLTFEDTTGNAVALPAGALIVGAEFITATAFSAATTVKLTIDSTDITAALTVTNAGVASFAAASTEAAAALWTNVGPADVFVTYTVSGTSLTTGAGTMVIQYVVRQADGTMYQSPSQV